MAAEAPSLFFGRNVQQFRGVVHAPCDQKVPGMVIVDAPDRLDVVHKGADALDVDKVPDLHGAVSGAGGEVDSVGVEGDVSDPVFVAFSRHDQFPVGDAPDLPGEVVGGGGDESFAGVDGHRGDALHVAFEGLCEGDVF